MVTLIILNIDVMNPTFLTLQDLADQTWKSLITIRRAVKKNNKIESKLEQGKLYAKREDVFKHFNIDYSATTQKQVGQSNEMTTQMNNHWLSSEQIDGLLDLSSKVIELTNEKTEMMQSLSLAKEEKQLELVKIHNAYQEDKTKIKQDAYAKEYALSKRLFVARFAVIVLLVVCLWLVLYVGHEYWVVIAPDFTGLR